MKHVVVAAALVALPVWVMAQATAPAAPASAPSAPSNTVRPEFGKPLQAAQDLLRAGSAKDALAKVAEAEALPAPTPFEALMVQRIKAIAAFGAGDIAGAITAFEMALASPLLAGNERRTTMESTINLAVQANDLPRAVRWFKLYFDEGGSDANLRNIYPQVLGLVGDNAAAVRETQALIKANDAAGKPTSEALLRTLGASANAIGDKVAYQAALEHLVVVAPSAQYWADLISRVNAREGFADERLRLDVYRLMQGVGMALEGSELLDMAERALAAGQPIEAKRVLDQGAAAGVLAKLKDQAGLQKLVAQVNKAAAQDRATLAESERSALAAKDGNALVAIGLAHWSMGAVDKAAELMTQGMAKGGLRRPDEAHLRLGMVLAGVNGKADAARSAFSAVAGNDGTADLARLWTLHLRRSPENK